MERPNTEFKFVGCANSVIECLQHLTLDSNVYNVQILNSSVLNALMLLLLLNAKFAKRMTMAATFPSKKTTLGYASALLIKEI